MKKLTFLMLFAMLGMMAEAITPDAYLVSNFDTKNVIPVNTTTGTQPVVLDGSNSVLQINRLVANATYAGCEFRNMNFGNGVVINNTPTTGYRYVVIRAKKATTDPFEIKLNTPTSGSTYIQINPVSGTTYPATPTWQTYVFDAGVNSANYATYKQLYISPEKGATQSDKTTLIDDVFFTNYLPSQFTTTVKPQVSYFRSATTITLTFNAPYARYFKIYVNNSGTYSLLHDNVLGISKEITGLTKNTSYTYKVVAYDENNNASLESDPITISTRKYYNSSIEVIDDFEGSSIGWYNMSNGNVTLSTTNAITDGINKSSKCAKVAIDINKTNYSGMAVATERLDVGPNAPYQYLHVKMYRDADVGGFGLVLMNRYDNNIAQITPTDLSVTSVNVNGPWVDYVFDLKASSLSTSNKTYSGFYFKPNSTSGTTTSASNSYIDDVYLSNSATPVTSNVVFTISTNSNTNNGTLNGAGTYLLEETVNLSATAPTGYTFSNWTESGNTVSTSFTANANRSLIANFTLSNSQYTISDFEGTESTNKNWLPTYVYNGSASVTADPDNSSNKVLTYNRAANDNTWAGPQWSGLTTTNPILMSGVGVGSNSSYQYRYLVVKAKKSTSYNFGATLQQGLNSATNVNGTLLNQIIQGEWVTYVFDFGNANGTYRLIYLQPESGGSASATTTYFDDIYFTNNPPVIATLATTSTASSITFGTASSGGNITADGGLSVTARGVCWSISQNPTISNTKTTDGTGTGTFTSSLTGLTPNTTYYVRSYATNSVGTSYGAQVSFTTLNEFTVEGTTSISSLTTLNASSVITVPTGTILTVDNSVNVAGITVAAGGKLTLSAGVITATNGITLQSSGSGTATFVDTNNSSPQAVIGTVEQYLGTARNWYMSSPIAGATVPTGQTYYSYNEAGGNTGFVAPASLYWVAVPQGTTITNPMKGYITQPGAPITKSYTGTFNTGTQSITLTRTNAASKPGFNLVANPYPSYLDWQMVDTTNVLSTVWYRTKTAGDAYTFDTYNGGLQVATTNGVNTVSKLIPPMQAFWVRVKSGVESTTLTFTNAMRKHVDVVGNKFKAPMLSETKLIRLRISNGKNADEALLCFNPKATNNLDTYDSPKMMNNSVDMPEIYTQIGAEKLVINGMKEIAYNAEIPIGFSTLTANDFSISANEISNLEVGTRVILIDKQNPNVEIELINGSVYNFSAPITSASTDRFSLVLRAPGTSTGVDKNETLNAQVFVNAANQITIIANEKANYSIYNALGVLNESGQTTAKLQTVNCKLQTGIYVVRVSRNGKELTTRVIIK